MKSSALLLLCTAAWGQLPVTRINPAIQDVVNQVSEDRITATLKKLQGFGTRYVLSPQNDPKYGIGAAQRWLVDESEATARDSK